MKRIPILLLLVAAAAAFAAEPIANLRGPSSPVDEPPAPRMTPYEDASTRRTRSYPEQPPVIPHDIDGYRIDLRSNKCLTCHARSRTEESGAPMVSITHFMDRDAQFRASVSPRRYFCNQCHVPQHEVKPLIDNQFLDVDEVLKRGAGAASN